MKYRKKPVVIEAFQLGYDDAPTWFKDSVYQGVITTHTSPTSHFDIDKPKPIPIWCEIRTLEGTMTGKLGDYIIRGVEGEIYPCNSDIFHKTYEKIISER